MANSTKPQEMERKRVSQFVCFCPSRERGYRYRVYIFGIIVDSSLVQSADCCNEQEDEEIDGGKHVL